MASTTVDWVERLPWDAGAPADLDRAARHPGVQRLTDAQLCQRIESNRAQLEEAKAFTHEQAEAAGDDLDDYRASIRKLIATYERALELRREYEGEP